MVRQTSVISPIRCGNPELVNVYKFGVSSASPELECGYGTMQQMALGVKKDTFELNGPSSGGPC